MALTFSCLVSFGLILRSSPLPTASMSDHSPIRRAHEPSRPADVVRQAVAARPGPYGVPMTPTLAAIVRSFEADGDREMLFALLQAKQAEDQVSTPLTGLTQILTGSASASPFSTTPTLASATSPPSLSARPFPRPPIPSSPATPLDPCRSRSRHSLPARRRPTRTPVGATTTTTTTRAKRTRPFPSLGRRRRGTADSGSVLGRTLAKAKTRTADTSMRCARSGSGCWRSGGRCRSKPRRPEFVVPAGAPGTGGAEMRCDGRGGLVHCRQEAESPFEHLLHPLQD